MLAAKNEGCIVRARRRSLKHEGIAAAQEAQVAVAQQDNKARVLSLVDKQGREKLEPSKMCEDSQRQFDRLFGTCGECDETRLVDFSAYLHSLSQISARKPECCVGDVTTRDV